MKGGRELPGIEEGFSPVRIISLQEARKVHTAIMAIGREDLQSRFDPTDMMGKEIYPQIWDRDPQEDDTFGYCLEYFELFKGFISDSIENYSGFVITIR